GLNALGRGLDELGGQGKDQLVILGLAEHALAAAGYDNRGLLIDQHFVYVVGTGKPAEGVALHALACVIGIALSHARGLRAVSVDENYIWLECCSLVGREPYGLRRLVQQ